MDSRWWPTARRYPRGESDVFGAQAGHRNLGRRQRVRRSWLTADSSDRRSSSALAMASAWPASSASSRCFTRPAACVATAVSTRRSRAANLRPAISIQNSSSPTSIAVSAESTSRHGFVPTHATVSPVDAPCRTRSMVTARWEYVSRTRCSSVARSAPRNTEPANRASNSASWDARRASRVRLAAPSTNTATATAIANNTNSVTAASGSAMVQV